MALDYSGLSENYRPSKIETLLVGEAPPPSGEKYFYYPKEMNPERDVRGYASLPATIFYHHFKSIPSTKEEYKEMLSRLQEKGIFLIDILDEPIRVRDRSYPRQVNPVQLRKVIDAIPKLRSKMKSRKIEISDGDITFLDPGHGYERYVRMEFPSSKIIKWADYRMSA
jgi:hypothetical protein